MLTWKIAINHENNDLVVFSLSTNFQFKTLHLISRLASLTMYFLHASSKSNLGGEEEDFPPYKQPIVSEWH